MKAILLLNVVLLLRYVESAELRIDPLVLIDQGLVRGQRAADGDYSTFLGIPYAEVDLENPFGESLDSPKFTGIFEANDSSRICPQTYTPHRPYSQLSTRSVQETLDCLRLNIFVPQQASTRNPLPVLFWIHGGSFGIGTAPAQVENLVRHGIIVVSINYRLGAYGFMCLDLPSVPGNQGLKDQYKALRWVRNNIAKFGGNPYNVTIGGHSAGAASTLFQVYAANEKLFNKVIVQSGSSLGEGMLVNRDEAAALKIAEYLGFNTSDSQQAINFLASSSPELVTGAVLDINLPLKPCIERSFSGVQNFIETDPITTSNERKVRNTPVLIGYTSHDSLLDVYEDGYLNGDPIYERLKYNFNLDEEQLREATDIVKHFYFGDSSLSAALENELLEFDADFVFKHPIERSVSNLIAENANPVYEYVFEYAREPEFRAYHSAEIPFMFSNQTPGRDELDQLVVDRLTTMWANFVKYGNPTPAVSDLLPVVWTPVSADNRPYLVISQDLYIENRVHKAQMAFWDLFYMIYGQYDSRVRSCQIH